MPFRDLRCQASRCPDASPLAPGFSVGAWYLGEADGRFHGTPLEADEVEARLEAAVSLAGYGGRGVVGVEASYPNEIHEGNLDLWRRALDGTGVRLAAVHPHLADDLGGALAHADDSVRQAAINRTAGALRLAREAEADLVAVWAGADGYVVPFGTDVVERRRRFVDGLAEAMDAAPGVRVALDAEPFEPRWRPLFGPAGGVVLARDVEASLGADENCQRLAEGHALVTMNPELGDGMEDEGDLPGTLAWSLAEGRLAHVHWSRWPLGRYLVAPGLDAPTPMEVGLYALRRGGYRGLIGLDVHPAGAPPVVALKVAMDAIRAACDRVNGLDLTALAEANDGRGRVGD
ncbi:sugar phosphate isomerase/epimerase family protein [Rubrivirga marina]|uniref:Xylose isomerase-like TIM barrel domain-containing protein n=1 Tax=Rubrivirga marina TaxID=1196024 RepID=A0A271IY34_9BACT|nr:TIM barrel protein [Rubrivirga marina]PAP76050.1 hypothetical protein BSZ37_06130 [Rubrivirga marina]